MAKLLMATDRCAKISGKKPSIVICYEAGYDAFWLARFLKAHGIQCLVIDSASMQVNRRSRRAKTDPARLRRIAIPTDHWVEPHHALAASCQAAHLSRSRQVARQEET